MALSNADEASEFDETYTPFIDALNDDLNTPNAISVVYEVVKKINQAVRQREIDVENLAVLVHTLEKMLYILGIGFDKITMSEEDKELYQNWRSAVKEKDFEKNPLEANLRAVKSEYEKARKLAPDGIIGLI